jgi:hypothetical protein
MRSLRYVLRLIFALEALGFLSLAFFTLRHSNVIATAQRFHLGRYSTQEFFWFILLLAVLDAIASWRLERGDPLGRWSLLAASIFNLLLLPVGILVAAAGIYYFVRNPAVDPKLYLKHRPIAGDGTSKWSGIIFVVAQLAWGVFILSSIRRWTVARGMHPIHSEALFWITLAAAVYGCILFHELGHLFLGDIVGFRLIGFGVGPLTLVRPGGRWRIHMRYDKLFGGHTAMVPTTPRNIRGRAMALTLGGPFASVLLGAIGTICLLLIPGPAWPAALGRTVALATGLAFGDFLFNLLPMASEAQYSDGARLWQMYRRGPWCDFHCANHYMGLSQTTPLRPRDWPSALVERAAEFAVQLPEPAGSFAMAYTHFLDCGNWQRALFWLDKAHLAARPGSRLAHALILDRAFLEAFYRRDGREALHWFDQAPLEDDSPDYWRSAATVRAAQGDVALASDAWKKACAIAQERPPTGVYDMDREQLWHIGAWLEQLRTQAISA